MASLMNGLSAAGAGIATFAGTAGLEEQKADLARRGLVLADQLAGARESAGRQEAGQIAAAAAEKQQNFLAGEGALNRTSAQTVAGIGAGATLGAAATAARAHLAATAISANAPPPEVKAAQFLANPNTTPEEKTAYLQAEALKSGLPVWAVTTPAPSASASGAPQAAPQGGTAAPVALPGDALVKPVSDAPKAATGTTGTTAGQYNESALDGTPPQAASMVKAMVDGRLSPPSSFAMAKPYWQTMLAKAIEYDPTFDETTWTGRVQTRKDFTGNGKDAQTVNALNTALGHAGDLLASFDKLNNFGGIGTPLNAPLNAIQGAFGDARQGVVQQNIDALAAEARKVFAGTGGGNLEELKEWQSKFPLNASPDQMKAYVGKFVGLMDSRLRSLADNYNRGMGRTSDPMELLSDHAREVYQNVTGNAPANATGNQLGKPATAPSPAPIAPADPAAREVGKSYPLPNGKTGIWRGTGWEVQP